MRERLGSSTRAAWSEMTLGIGIAAALGTARLLSSGLPYGCSSTSD